jgi:hypothetical protein
MNKEEILKWWKCCPIDWQYTILTSSCNFRGLPIDSFKYLGICKELGFPIYLGNKLSCPDLDELTYYKEDPFLLMEKGLRVTITVDFLLTTIKYNTAISNFLNRRFKTYGTMKPLLALKNKLTFVSIDDEDFKELDIDFFWRNNTITSFELQRTKIKDFSPISLAPNIKYLDLSYNTYDMK